MPISVSDIFAFRCRGPEDFPGTSRAEPGKSAIVARFAAEAVLQKKEKEIHN